MDPISNPSTDARSLASLIASATAVAPRTSEPLVTDRYKLEDRPLERRGFRFGDTFTRDRREEVDAFTRLTERLRRAAAQREAAEPVEQPPSPSALAPAAGADLASPVAESSGTTATTSEPTEDSTTTTTTTTNTTTTTDTTTTTEATEPSSDGGSSGTTSSTGSSSLLGTLLGG